MSETHVTCVQAWPPIVIVIVEEVAPKFVPVNVVVTDPWEVLGLGAIEVMVGGEKDSNFGGTCVFEIPFEAVTVTAKLPPTPTALQIILVFDHEEWGHVTPPTATDLDTPPVWSK